MGRKTLERLVPLTATAPNRICKTPASPSPLDRTWSREEEHKIQTGTKSGMSRKILIPVSLSHRATCASRQEVPVTSESSIRHTLASSGLFWFLSPEVANSCSFLSSPLHLKSKCTLLVSSESGGGEMSEVRRSLSTEKKEAHKATQERAVCV